MATIIPEAYRDNALPLHHIIPLDFSSLRTLPDSHAWPQPSDHDGVDDAAGSSSIPMIDLMDPSAMELIGLACESWGAFQLKNHGIPLRIIEEVEAEAKRLFDLPSEIKLKALRSSSGATGYGRARISRFFPKYMWHEGFTLMGSPSDDAKKIWPNDYARFCDIMENYQKQMKSLAEKLTHMILNLLGVSEEEKKWVGADKHVGVVQLNSYPSCPEPNRAMGLAPHTDTSLLTIIHQSQTSGLQIFKEGAGWVTVHPHDPDTLVVHTGDILHIHSNARFRCALHRATVNGARHRYSTAYFYVPPVDHVISPLVHDSVPRFRALTVKEYIDIKEKNLRGALSVISVTKS